jgi:hypothetical protein
MPLRTGLSIAQAKKFWWLPIPIIIPGIYYKLNVEVPRRKKYFEWFRDSAENINLGPDMFNRSSTYRRYVNNGLGEIVSQREEQLMALLKGESKTVGGRPFDINDKEDLKAMHTALTDLKNENQHLLKQNKNAERWNRQFLGLNQ